MNRKPFPNPNPLRPCPVCRCRMSLEFFTPSSPDCRLCIKDRIFLNGVKRKAFEPAKAPRFVEAA